MVTKTTYLPTYVIVVKVVTLVTVVIVVAVVTVVTVSSDSSDQKNFFFTKKNFFSFSFTTKKNFLKKIVMKLKL